MDTFNPTTHTTNVHICPLNAGIKINDTHVKDPNDGKNIKMIPGGGYFIRRHKCVGIMVGI